MAMAEPVSSTLRLVLYEGEDEETGNPIYKSKSFNNVKVSANADQLFIVAEAFTQLQELPLYSVDRKSTRLNSSHVAISYAVFCLKKKNKRMKVLSADRRTAV